MTKLAYIWQDNAKMYEICLNLQGNRVGASISIYTTSSQKPGLISTDTRTQNLVCK